MITPARCCQALRVPASPPSPLSPQFKPTHVLNAAGVTGRPNVDWCETHKVETIRANVIGCLTLADVCNQRGIHMTYYGTGCIFHYDDKFPQGSGKGFMESDTPNFTGSYYSYTKVGAGRPGGAAFGGPGRRVIGMAGGVPFGGSAHRRVVAGSG